MNLTRQMQGLADLYSSIKPIEEKTYTPQQSGNHFSSASDKNLKTLNNMYTEIYNKGTKGAAIVNEKVEEGEFEKLGNSREQLILKACMSATENMPKDSDINSLVFDVSDDIKSKTGKGLTDEEGDMAINELKKMLNQEDEIDTTKSDLNKDGKLSEYEKARGSAIDKAMGGSGELPKGEHVTEAKKSYSAKQAKAGKDIGKPGKQFKKIAKGAAKKYGSKKAGQKVAGAVLAKLRSEKFDFFGGKKNPNLMTGANYKPQKAKTFKQPGKVKFQSLPTATETPTKTPFIKNSGPESDGVELPQTPIEPGGTKENFYDVNKFSQGVKKIAKENINNDMSKSIFDKLYEDVMGDEDAIALGAAEAEAEAGAPELEAGDEGENVTLTIPREVAQHLHALLSDILSGSEELEDEGEVEEIGEEDEQQPMMGYGEEIEAEELGHPLVNQKKGDPIPVKGKGNVVDSTVSKLAKPGKGGDGKVTDKVGNDGDEGHPLVNQTKGTELTNVKGKSNVVKSTTSSKVGDTFFQPA